MSSLRGVLTMVVFGLTACAAAWAQGTPAFGPNVLVVRPTDVATAEKAAGVQAKIDAIYAAQQHSEFGSRRDAVVLLPGEYALNVPVGFYTEVMGVGASPAEVRVHGDVHADAALKNNNATTTFWRAVEGMEVTPPSGTMQWAVSQATSLRRMHVRGDLTLHQQHGWASGGWMADTRVEGTVDSGTQQQWISRNCDWKTWTGSNWNMVFVGVPEAPATTWPKPAWTSVAKAPETRERPFLVVDKAGAWGVRVPAVARESAGVTWSGGETPGRTVPIDQFYVTHAGTDTAATMNAALASGKNLLLTPGIYELEAPLRVTRKDTVVLGMGYATLKPVSGTAAMETADVDGIVVAGLLFDAGATESPVLLRVGPRGSKAHHAANPTTVSDVYFRVGGAAVGRVDINFEVNSSDTIIDQTWVWRADHGAGVGWDQNLSRNGVVVNGDNVIAYGLFVEHHQQYQTLWKGERGRTYLYQSEIPYDPPTQASFSSGPGVKGWASYKVGDAVTTHEAWGLGIYSVFRHPDVELTRAIEVPKTPGVRLHDMITTCLDTLGRIDNIVDEAGGPATCQPRNWPRLTSFPE